MESQSRTIEFSPVRYQSSPILGSFCLCHPTPLSTRCKAPDNGESTPAWLCLPSQRESARPRHEGLNAGGGGGALKSAGRNPPCFSRFTGVRTVLPARPTRGGGIHTNEPSAKHPHYPPPAPKKPAIELERSLVATQWRATENAAIQFANWQRRGDISPGPGRSVYLTRHTHNDGHWYGL